MRNSAFERVRHEAPSRKACGSWTRLMLIQGVKGREQNRPWRNHEGLRSQRGGASTKVVYRPYCKSRPQDYRRSRQKMGERARVCINCNSHYLVSRTASDQIDAHRTGIDSWIFLMTMHTKAPCHITSPHRAPLARVGVAVGADAPAPLIELLAVGFGVNDRVHQRSAGSRMTDQPDCPAFA